MASRITGNVTVLNSNTWTLVASNIKKVTIRDLNISAIYHIAVLDSGDSPPSGLPTGVSDGPAFVRASYQENWAFDTAFDVYMRTTNIDGKVEVIK